MTPSADRASAQRLILGGHSFIRQLGSDPYPDESTQVRLVEACLNAGITWFDTTYQPERVALGHALHVLGRRDEAHLIAWNFFHAFSPQSEADVGGPEPWEAHRLQQVLDELQTTHLDSLVIHAVQDFSRDRAQEHLVDEWRQQGFVSRVGMWGWQPEAHIRQPSPHCYSFMVQPRNVTNAAEADRAIQAAHHASITTLACSPYIRGWELDALATLATARGLSHSTAKNTVASLLLRFSLFAPGVEKLIVAMRDIDWISANLAAVEQGPLSPDEQHWLRDLMAAKTSP